VEKLLGEPITDQILSEVTFVHRANLRNDGRVTETDYLLFKLLQLQKVDVAVLEKLVDRYHALDVDNSGTLEIGLEVPSAAQVEELRRRAAAEVAEGTVEEERPLRVLWNEAQQQRRGQRRSASSSKQQRQQGRGGGECEESAASDDHTVEMQNDEEEKVGGEEDRGSVPEESYGQYFTRLT
jgi:hypothetical protein